MKIKQFKFLFWICFRHSINPLRKNRDNRYKYRSRLSEKEKQWVIDNCHESSKGYFNELMREKQNIIM